VTAAVKLLSAAAGVALTAIVSATWACGFEDPDSIGMRRGALNFAFPQSLHVGTAIWQAQLAGRLPRDPLALQGDLPPEARASLRMLQANSAFDRLALRIGTGPTSSSRPNLAVVLLGPVLWARFEAGAVRPLVHVRGPEDGDVVIVTDLAALEAIADGSLGFSEALDLGVLRLYGTAGDVAQARRWLGGIAPG